MTDTKMRKALIKLASKRPELRVDLLPIITASLKTGTFYDVSTVPGFTDFPSPSQDPFYRTLPTLVKTVARRMLPVDWDTFLNEKDNVLVENPDTGMKVKIRSLNGPKGSQLKTQLWREWRQPRESYNRKLLVAEIAANTGKAVAKVNRELREDLGAAILTAKGNLQDILVEVADRVGNALPPNLYRRLFGPTQDAPAQLRLGSLSKKYLSDIQSRYPELKYKIAALNAA